MGIISDRNIVRTEALSYEQILNDLVSYVSAQPDGDRWRDYFTFSEGATLMEMMAAIGAFLRYNALMVGRESTPLTAQLKSSIYGMADLFGYPVARRKAPTLRLTLTSPSDIYLDRQTPIGTIAGRDMSLLKSTQLNRGVNVLDVAVGSWVEVEQTAEDDGSFSIISWRVDSSSTDTKVDVIEAIDDERVEIFVNDEPIIWSKHKEELGLGADCAVSTLAYSISILFGGAGLGRSLQKDDVIKLRYLKVDAISINSRSYVTDNISMTNGGLTPTNLAIINPYYAEDSLRKLVVTMGGYYASQRRMVTKEDHVSILKSYTGMISAKWHHGTCLVNSSEDQELHTEAECTYRRESTDDTTAWIPHTSECCTASLTYLFEDEHWLDTLEREEVLKYVDPYIMEGTELVLINPEPVSLSVIGEFVVKIGTDSTVVTNQINAAIDLFCKELGVWFKVKELEAAIRDIDSIEYIYLAQPIRDLRLGTKQYLRRSTSSFRFTTDPQDIQHSGWDGDDKSGYNFRPVDQ